MNKVKVEVTKVELLCPTIKLFEFKAVEGEFKPFTAGGHITVHMDEVDISRSYSLISDPRDSQKYQIAVLLDENSRGGSVHMHTQIAEGDQLYISEADNFFPLEDDSSSKHVLIAGGIGITPFISYLYELDEKGLDFELHYTFRDEENAAFVEYLTKKLGDKLFTYDNAKDQRLSVRDLISANKNNTHFYTCGPTPLIDDVIATGTEIVGSERVHYENFGEVVNTGSAFEVVFNRSGFSLEIDEDMSILQAIEADKRIQVECICRNGVCGTCETTILEGEADHRDEYLDDEEREAQETMMICVSRAKGSRLVLDL